MPVYSTPVQIAVLGPPIDPPFPLFNAETRSAGDVSIPIQWAGRIPGGDENYKVFTATFASAPTAAVVDILASDTNKSVNDYGVVGTITFAGTQTKGFYTDTAPSNFYVARLTSVTGGSALTVTISA